MKSYLVLTLFTAFLVAGTPLPAAPLRVLVTSDSDAFLNPYAASLKTAGALVVTASEPDEAKLSRADVVLIHREKFDALPAGTQAALTAFAERGGGIVAVNGAVATGTTDWGKATLGGAWDDKDSRKFTSKMMLYVVSNSHPIVKDSSPFDVDDDTLYDLVLSDDIFVLSSAFTPKGRDGRRGDGPRVPGRDVRASIYDLQPQAWTYESPRRARDAGPCQYALVHSPRRCLDGETGERR
jgi:hypothetical protein